MSREPTWRTGVGGRGAAVWTLKSRWKIYLYEAAGLGGFLLAVGIAEALLFAEPSPLYSTTSSDVLKRVLVGLSAGGYLVALVYSPWGKESGAQINPSITLAFLRLGKMHLVDALIYIVAHFAGAILGVAILAALMGSLASAPQVEYIVTRPGSWGWSGAFAAEFAITLVMMTLVLESSSSSRFRPYTGLFCGTWLAVLILVESPISGTSLNPARSTGSDVIAVQWNSLLLYFIAPPLGAQVAACLYRLGDKGREPPCAKLHHHAVDDPGTRRCIMKNCAPRRAAEAAMLHAKL
jgi:aquaporin Z